MHFLEFEKPLEALYHELEKLQEVGQKSHVDISSTEKELLKKIETLDRTVNNFKDCKSRDYTTASSGGHGGV